MATDWTAEPDHFLLKEVVAKTRHSLGTAYRLLERGVFPIAHVAGVKPYRFLLADVRAYVERGHISNPAARPAPRRYFTRATRRTA